MDDEPGPLQLVRALTSTTSLIKILTVVAVLVTIMSAMDQRTIPARGVLPADAMATAVVAAAGLIALALDSRS